MHELINKNGWVWIFIQDPGGNEQYVGQYYQKEDISFIPAFIDKKEAMECYERMALDKDKKYEAQAIQYDELTNEASKNGFVVFLLNGQGDILDMNVSRTAGPQP